MKARVPVIVKDPGLSLYKDIGRTEDVLIEEEAFLDGPVSPRVAVLDFLPGSGGLAPGVPFRAPRDAAEEGAFEIAEPIEADAPRVAADAAAVSVFGATHKTMRMFEEPDGLGRKVAWAFDAPQLLVVPRAGEWANAYYERETHSLQFFYFKGHRGPLVYTCLSQDIIAHEAAHALVDGVAPDLYSAITPQSLAIHEAVADIAALLCSLRCRELTERVLEDTGGVISNSSVFSGLAGEFGRALGTGSRYLRNLNNDKRLGGPARGGEPVDASEPHDLSEVLSGAFYSVLLKTHAELTRHYLLGTIPSTELIAELEEDQVQRRIEHARPAEPARGEVAASAKALFVAAERLKRTVLRGLDYLPPGDATFADFARAVMAADEASHPESSRQRRWLAEEFLRRGIVTSAAELDVETNFAASAVAGLDLDALVTSDYVAYTFANEHRAFLGIPDSITFEVQPRLDVTKLYWHRDGKREVRECLFKVSWTEVEDNPGGRGLPGRRRYLAGTTLAIEWSPERRVRALLHSSRTAGHRADTNRLIARLVDEDMLRVGDLALGATGQPMRGVINGDVLDGILKIRGAGRMLHVTQERGW